MSHELAPNGNGSARSLSGREHRVLVMTAQGYRPDEIGAALYLSPKTVKNHKANIYGALGGVKNRYHAVLTALEQGELEQEEVVNGTVILRFPRLERRPALHAVLDAMRTDLGASSKTAEVAARLDLSPKTVKNHQAAICDVLETRIVPAVVNFHLVFPEATTPVESQPWLRMQATAPETEHLVFERVPQLASV